MTRPAALALAALAVAAPLRGGAQLRPSPMVIPAPAGADALPGRFSPAAAGDELLVLDRATGAALLRAHRALLSAAPWPHVLPAGTPVRAGRTRANAADLLADLAYAEGDDVVVRYGNAPDQPVARSGPGEIVSFARVMPHDGDVLLVPSPDLGSGLGWIDVWDFETSSLGGTALVATWRADGLAPLEATSHEAAGLRLSAAALAHAIDDVALPVSGGVLLLAHLPATADGLYATLPAFPWDLALAEVRVGGPSALDRPPWLPPTVSQKGDALGAAALDLDLDGQPDLLFAYGSAVDHDDGQGGILPNHLVLVRGTGDPRDLAHPAGLWEDVTAHPALALRDPVTLRQIDLGGVPALAVWDRALDEVVVAWSEAGAIRTWRGAALGRRVRDLRVADLVGSAAPDLVALADDVLVFPDAGDASPTLAWSEGSPGAPVRGGDLVLSAVARDPDGEAVVEWFVGDPHGAPAAPAELVPAGEARVVGYTHPGALLCEPPPQRLLVTVRATDALGVHEELSAELEVSVPVPALALEGSLPGGILALPPGGTGVAFDASSSPSACGPIAFTWGGTLFGAATSFVDETTAVTARRSVDLPEADYPALLAVPAPDVTLVAGDAGVESAPARLAVHLDATGLVEAEHSVDVAALAPGEVALLRTVVRSRLGVPLPEVRLVDRLSGLAAAGPPRVAGAAVVSTAHGGAELVLDLLPAGGAEVEIELPVRLVGARGASAVEVRSSGGHLLTAPARLPGTDEARPGCGCGDPGGGAPGLLALAALLALRGRRRARAT